MFVSCKTFENVALHRENSWKMSPTSSSLNSCQKKLPESCVSWASELNEILRSVRLASTDFTFLPEEPIVPKMGMEQPWLTSNSLLTAHRSVGIKNASNYPITRPSEKTVSCTA